MEPLMTMRETALQPCKEAPPYILRKVGSHSFLFVRVKTTAKMIKTIVTNANRTGLKSDERDEGRKTARKSGNIDIQARILNMSTRMEEDSTVFSSCTSLA
jgi:hypothetical protein